MQSMNLANLPGLAPMAVPKLLHYVQATEFLSDRRQHVRARQFQETLRKIMWLEESKVLKARAA